MNAQRMSTLCQLFLLLLMIGLAFFLVPAAEARMLKGGQHEWRKWKTRYGKTYIDPLHESKAHVLWLRHWQLVQSHNSRPDVSFTLELNAFADQEFRQEMPAQESQPLRYVPEMTSYSLSGTPPPSFDWRTKGVISPVKNQGQMGSADAIAVTEDLESLHAIRTGQLVALSSKEVTDCCSATPEPGQLVPDIYECIAQHGGLCSEAGYPDHHSPPVCRNDSCPAVAKDAHVTVHVPPGNESAMLTAVLQCPLVVYVDAGHVSFQLYRQGVYDDPQCGYRLDHTLQLVGFGSVEGQDFWILKNSWGADWGMQGYMWMQRGSNMCGIADNALYPK